MRRSRMVLAACACAALSALAARADTLHLKDGRSFEGVLKSESRSAVVFEVVVSGIRSEMTFARHDIDRIEKGELTAEEDARERAETPARIAPTRERAAVSERVHYLVVPIQGVFGVDVAPAGVADALEFATRRGIPHVVFQIDSPGGYAWAAEQIAETMERYAGGLTYSALIDEALSAACWVALSCDRVFMAPGSSMGAAVGYTRDRSTGAVEVDAKFNSASAARLASIAEKNGHSAAMARAFILLENEAHAVEVAPGQWRIEERAPEGVRSVALATKTSILTLTAEEAATYGVATSARTPEDVGAALGIGGFTKFNEYGEAAMRKAGQALARGEGNPVMLSERLDALVALINASIEEAAMMAPELTNVTYHVESGLLTQASQDEWRRRCDAAAQAVTKALRDLDEYSKVRAELEAMGVEVAQHELVVEDVRADLRQRLAWLRANRTKRYFP